MSHLSQALGWSPQTNWTGIQKQIIEKKPQFGAEGDEIQRLVEEEQINKYISSGLHRRLKKFGVHVT